MPNTKVEDHGYAERQGGYTAAASWLARDPDNETFVFRKFDRLAAVNLLYLQSEILDLEKRLDDMHLLAIRSHDMELKDAACTWETLVEQSTGPNARDDAKKRMHLIRELRRLLREYRECYGSDPFIRAGSSDLTGLSHEQTRRCCFRARSRSSSDPKAECSTHSGISSKAHITYSGARRRGFLTRPKTLLRSKPSPIQITSLLSSADTGQTRYAP